MMLHSEVDGIFERLDLHPDVEKCVIEKDLWVTTGDSIKAFRGANDAMGTLILKCNSPETIECILQKYSQMVNIKCLRH